MNASRRTPEKDAERRRCVYTFTQSPSDSLFGAPSGPSPTFFQDPAWSRQETWSRSTNRNLAVPVPFKMFQPNQTGRWSQMVHNRHDHGHPSPLISNLSGPSHSRKLFNPTAEVIPPVVQPFPGTVRVKRIQESVSNCDNPDTRFWCVGCNQPAKSLCEEHHSLLSFNAALKQQIPSMLEQFSKGTNDVCGVLKAMAASCGVSESLGALEVLSGSESLSCTLTVHKKGEKLLDATWPLSQNQPSIPEDKILRVLALLLINRVSSDQKQDSPQEHQQVPPSPAQEEQQPTIIKTLDVYNLSQKGAGEWVFKPNKAKLLGQIRQQGVQKLINVFCHADAAWALSLLRMAAPKLEELKVWCAGREHVLALAGMPRLRRLYLHASAALLADADPPAVSPPAVSDDEDDDDDEEEGGDGPLRVGLRWLSVYDVPRKTKMSLLRAHAATLEHLEMSSAKPVDSPTAVQDFVDDVVVLQSLKSLRRLVLWSVPEPDFGFSHEQIQCRNLKGAMKTLMPWTAVYCGWCDSSEHCNEDI